MTRRDLMREAYRPAATQFGDAATMSSEELTREFMAWTHRVNTDPDAIRQPKPLIPTDYRTVRYFKEWRRSGQDQHERLDEFIAKKESEIYLEKRRRNQRKDKT
jgi:hypothetical protein